MMTMMTIAAAFLAATTLISSAALASPSKPYDTPRPAVASHFDALSQRQGYEVQTRGGCIGLSSGTADASCGSLTGGPSGGLN